MSFSVSCNKSPSSGQLCPTSIVPLRMYQHCAVENVPQMEFMYLVLILLAWKVSVTGGDADLCCCVRVTSFERLLTPLFVDSSGSYNNVQAGESVPYYYTDRPAGGQVVKRRCKYLDMDARRATRPMALPVL